MSITNSVNYSFQASQENKPSEEETLEANETYVAREIAPRYMYSGSNSCELTNKYGIFFSDSWMVT
ncbi:18104_t:CDS:2, partial [Rhizophagus irregularis]